MGLYVTRDGKEIKDDPARYVLLYMPLENLERVQDFLNETGLDKKFDVIESKIYIKHEQSDESSDPIETLILRMKSDKVLFEYKLSGKNDGLLEQLNEYFYGEEKD